MAELADLRVDRSRSQWARNLLQHRPFQRHWSLLVALEVWPEHHLLLEVQSVLRNCRPNCATRVSKRPDRTLASTATDLDGSCAHQELGHASHGHCKVPFLIAAAYLPPAPEPLGMLTVDIGVLPDVLPDVNGVVHQVHHVAKLGIL